MPAAEDVFAESWAYLLLFLIMRLNAIAVVAFAACSCAAPHAATHAIHEKRDYTPSNWLKHDRVSAAAIIPVRVGLTQSNLEKGYDFLMDV